MCSERQRSEIICGDIPSQNSIQFAEHLTAVLELPVVQLSEMTKKWFGQPFLCKMFSEGNNTGEIEVLIIITVKSNQITKSRYKKIFKSGVFAH